MNFYESLHFYIKDKKITKKSTEHKNLEIIVANGYDKDSFVQDVQNDIHASSSLSGRSTEEIKTVDQNLEQTGKPAICIHQGILPYLFVESVSYE